MGKNDFDKNWIKIDKKTIEDNYESLILNEIDNSRDSIKDDLVETIISHYNDNRVLKNFLKDEKFAELNEYIVESLPTVSRFKKGDFGEIIWSEHLKQRYGYYFPILKLQIKTNPNTPLFGEDIWCFKYENKKITGVCIAESKVVAKQPSTSVKKAYDQLQDYTLKPKIIHMINNILAKFDDNFVDELYRIYFLEDFKDLYEESLILVISGENIENTLKLNNYANDLNNLKIFHLYLEDLFEFIEELFQCCGEYYHD